MADSQTNGPSGGLGLIEWWSGLDVALQSALIGAGATLVVAIIGVWIIFVQIGRQANHAIEQNRENAATKLKLDIYVSISEAIAEATKAAGHLSSSLRTAVEQLEQARREEEAGRPWRRPSLQFPDLKRAVEASGLTQHSILRLAERWMVIDPRVDVFLVAFTANHHDFFNAYFRDLVPAVIPLLPADDPSTGQPFPWEPPLEEDLKALDGLVRRVIETVNTQVYYLTDFERAMQNELVGGLFGNEVAPRQPLDPQHLVIVLDRHEELRQFLYTRTPWGIHRAQIIRDLENESTERNGSS